MKFYFFFLFLFTSSGLLFSQNKGNDALKIVLNKESIRRIPAQPVAIPFIKLDTLMGGNIDIKAEHWDTTTFNPYLKTLAKFPIKIKFTDSTYHSPVNRPKVITSRFGWRHGRAHEGIDIDLATGDTVFAVLDGIVRFAGYTSGFGKTIILRHYNSLETAYTHLSEISVTSNDSISGGQMIAKGGNTGRSTGSHLHFITSFQGEYINPDYLFDFSEENEIRSNEVWVSPYWTRAVYHDASKQSTIEILASEEAAIASASNLGITKKRKTYIVKSGDTLFHISKRNNISVATLMKNNGIKKASKLKIGQKLVL